MSAKVIDLDALSNPARQAAVRLGGVDYVVLPITAAAALRIAVAYEGDKASDIVGAMTEAARSSVPSMPPEVFTALSVDAVSAIVGIARDGADAVEAMMVERAKAEAVAGNG